MDISFLSRSAFLAKASRQRMQREGRTPLGHVLWSKEEDALLLKNRDRPIGEIAHMFSRRTRNALIARRVKLGCSFKSQKNWRPEEDRILREHTPKLNWRQISLMLPGRSRAAVQGRARYIGIANNEFSRARHRPKIYRIPLLDAVRLRAWEDGISLEALDKELKSGGYFRKNGMRKRNKRRDYVNIWHIKKAVEFFGGELVIDWKDE